MRRGLAASRFESHSAAESALRLFGLRKRTPTQPKMKPAPTAVSFRNRTAPLCRAVSCANQLTFPRTRCAPNPPTLQTQQFRPHKVRCSHPKASDLRTAIRLSTPSSFEGFRSWQETDRRAAVPPSEPPFQRATARLFQMCLRRARLASPLPCRKSPRLRSNDAICKELQPPIPAAGESARKDRRSRARSAPPWVHP